MDNTKIDWADMTWNPVTGCRHGCEYCYAARTAGRFAGYLSQGVKVSNDTRKEEIVQEVKKPNCEREGIVVLDKPLKTMTAAGNVVNAPLPFRIYADVPPLPAGGSGQEAAAAEHLCMFHGGPFRGVGTHEVDRGGAGRMPGGAAA